MKEKIYQMFDDRDGIYNYCPAPVRVDGNKLAVFYCSNTWPGLVIDDIYCRTGTQVDGWWMLGEKFRVLSPSRQGWDCIHVCDPDVIRGEFHLGGETYSWMMVYLGCDIHYCYHNQIGVAFAKNIEGPYVRLHSNPIIGYGEILHWGVGQACVLSLDGKGKFRILYTKTVHEYARHFIKEHTFWRDIDLYDADHPVIGEEVAMHTGGMEEQNGSGNVFVLNPTIVWDRKNDLYYLTRDGTPFDTQTMPDFIASYTQISVISRADFERNEGGWKTIWNIGEKDTGYHRNHNAGVFKDSYGYLYQDGVLPVAVTVSELKDTDFLWTYRIHYSEARICPPLL